jgi:SagB-type dehydrogenase family enzyme
MRKNWKLTHLLDEPSYSWEKFHQKTKFKKWSPFPDPANWPQSWKTTYFKEYPRLDKIVLPPPHSLKNTTLEEVLLKRKSTRNFSKKPLSLEQISNLLFYSAGLRENEYPWVGNRTYPSPGGRYALEVYLISQNSELPLGVYHYNLRSHSLEFLLEMENFNNPYYFNQYWTEQSSIIVLITAIFERNTIKYGQRGYRHVLEEAGHMGQNFYLVGTGLNIGVSGIGGYLDDELNSLLDIDGIRETVIYVLGAGNSQSSKI